MTSATDSQRGLGEGGHGLTEKVVRDDANTVTPLAPLPPFVQRLPRFLHVPYRVLAATVQGFAAENIPTHAASLAYFTMFSIAPTVLIVVSIVGAFFGEEAARGQIEGQIESLVGTTGAKAIEDMVANTKKDESNLLASIIGVVGAVFGASGVFAALQGTLNAIWRAPAPKMNGILAFLRNRLLSFTMVLVVGFLLLVSLVVSAVLSAVGAWVGGQFTGWEVVVGIVNNVVSFAVIGALFAAMFKVLPDTPIAWRDVWLGAGVTAALFTVGKWLIAQYLSRTAVASSYGAAGSLAVLLIWVFYSALLLYGGAVLTRSVAQLRGAFPAVAPTPVVHLSR